MPSAPTSPMRPVALVWQDVPPSSPKCKSNKKLPIAARNMFESFREKCNRPSHSAGASRRASRSWAGNRAISPASIFTNVKLSDDFSGELSPTTRAPRLLSSGLLRLPQRKQSAVSVATGVASQPVAAPALQCLQFARTGPLWPAFIEACGGIEPTPEEINRHANCILTCMPGDHVPDVASLKSTDPLVIRTLWLYVPLFGWILAQLRHRKAKEGSTRPLVVGISAPQGCGKTTLVTLMQKMLSSQGHSCVAASYDDFYKTGSEQEALASAYEGNPLLQHRGNAGTHDLVLITNTLKALCDRTRTEPVSIPRYDKSARNGKGDRASLQSWSKAETPVDVVLLEGWMAGFKPLDPGAPFLKEHEGLAEVNRFLSQYEELDSLIDAWVVIRVHNPVVVFNWRLQAEHEMKAKGAAGMSDTEIRGFCQRFMPAYAAYLPELYCNALKCGVDGKPTITCMVDAERRPTF